MREFWVETEIDGAEKLQIRARLWPAHKTGQKTGQRTGQLVILPGFSEFMEKYDPALARLAAAGWQSLVLDWPGQGRSGHLGRRSATCHIDDFSQHIDALGQLLQEAGFLQQRFSILGHSMGGHLAMRAAHHWQDRIDGLVLCAPMVRPRPGPGWLIEGIAGLAAAFGFQRSGIFPHRRNRPPPPIFPADNKLTRDQQGWLGWIEICNSQPDLWRSGPSVGWVRAAYRSGRQTVSNPAWLAELAVPSLALLAGNEQLVSNSETLRALARMPDARHICFAGARHELLLELPQTRDEVFAEIEAFLAETRS